jgi:hypothetical protein
MWRSRKSIIGAAIVACSIGLPGCSISYDIEVLLRDGRVTFDMSYRFLFGRGDACIEELIVREVSDTQDIVWQLKAPQNECPEVRYLPYGATPAGVNAAVPAARLKTGQLYTVNLTALGGWGTKTFVILPRDHEVYGRIATLP